MQEWFTNVEEWINWFFSLPLPVAVGSCTTLGAFLLIIFTKTSFGKKLYNKMIDAFANLSAIVKKYKEDADKAYNEALEEFNKKTAELDAKMREYDNKVKELDNKINEFDSKLIDYKEFNKFAIQAFSNIRNVKVQALVKEQTNEERKDSN